MIAATLAFRSRVVLVAALLAHAASASAAGGQNATAAVWAGPDAGVRDRRVLYSASGSSYKRILAKKRPKLGRRPDSSLDCPLGTITEEGWANETSHTDAATGANAAAPDAATSDGTAAATSTLNVTMRCATAADFELADFANEAPEEGSPAALAAAAVNGSLPPQSGDAPNAKAPALELMSDEARLEVERRAVGRSKAGAFINFHFSQVCVLARLTETTRGAQRSGCLSVARKQASLPRPHLINKNALHAARTPSPALAKNTNAT